jgi:hypothetical protein
MGGMHLFTKQLTLVDLYSYSDCRLIDLPKIERDLVKKDKKIIQIIAKRLGE